MHFSWSTLLLQTVNFAVLVWLLHRFLYKPALRAIDARRAEIEKQYAAAQAAGTESKARLEALESERANIASERSATLKSAAVEAEAAAGLRRAKAEQEAAALIEAGRKTLAAEREQALALARRQALDLGVDLARRLMAEMPMALRAEAWLERIERHLASMPEQEREGLFARDADGAQLIVVSATAFPRDSQEQWRERLRKRFGDRIEVDFETDSALVAGVELKAPTAVLRFSLRSTMAALRAEIEADDKSR